MWEVTLGEARQWLNQDLKKGQSEENYESNKKRKKSFIFYSLQFYLPLLKYLGFGLSRREISEILSASTTIIQRWNERMLFRKKLDFYIVKSRKFWSSSQLPSTLWSVILQCKGYILSDFNCLYYFLCSALDSNPHL